ncbi:DUF461 domain-containing protein [Streptomyces sp. NPDC007264]|uniref:DUF461 domain-containing protein n=1 Tax=Streptomyces sp. NPDC007264 TaxID=3364777 RepID=UPI0036DCE3E3
MSSSLRRGALAAAAIAFSISSLAACGAGNDSETLQIKPDNAATSVGDIKIQNAIVVTQPDPQSTGPAVISATVFNNSGSAQTLDSVALDGTGKTADLTPASGTGKLTVPAHGSLVIGGKGNASAVIQSSREAVQDGNAQKITFSFSKAGDVSLRAFVVPAEGYFDQWGPSNIPSPTATETAASSPSTETTGTPTGKATSTSTAAGTAG